MRLGKKNTIYGTEGLSRVDNRPTTRSDIIVANNPSVVSQKPQKQVLEFEATLDDGNSFWIFFIDK
jgi:hypothetical protein